MSVPGSLGPQPISLLSGTFQFLFFLAPACFVFIWAALVLYPLLNRLVGQLDHVPGDNEYDPNLGHGKRHSVSTGRSWTHSRSFSLSQMASDSLGGASVNHHNLGQIRMRTLFAITIACSTVVVQLVLCEIVKWCDPDVRVMVWQITVFALNALLIFVLPFMEIYIFSLKYWPALLSARATGSMKTNNSIRLAATLLIFMTWLFLFYHIGDFLPLKRINIVPVALSSISSGTLTSSLDLSQSILTRITFIGVTLMAILSGVGAVAAPFFSFFNFSHQVTQPDIDRLSRSLDSVSNMVDFKQTEFNQLRQHQPMATTKSTNENFPSSVKSFSASTANLVKMMMTFTNSNKEGTVQDDIRYEYKALELEINSLVRVKYGLRAELQQKRSRFEAQHLESTTLGKLKSIAYMIFAVYCIYRLITCLIMRNPLWYKFYHGSIFHALTSSERKSDALSVTLAHIITQISTPTTLKGTSFYRNNIDAWSRQIGFALSGGLFLGSVSSVVTTFNALIKLIPVINQTNNYLQQESLPWSPNHSTNPSTASNQSHNSSSSSSLKHISLGVLLTSQITGTYVLATTLLLRSNLPDEMSKSITVALGSPLDVRFIDSWFDIVFGFTSMTTIVGLYLSKKYNSLDDADLNPDNMYDEESYLDNNKYA